MSAGSPRGIRLSDSSSPYCQVPLRNWRIQGTQTVARSTHSQAQGRGGLAFSVPREDDEQSLVHAGPSFSIFAPRHAGTAIVVRESPGARRPALQPALMGRCRKERRGGHHVSRLARSDQVGGWLCAASLANLPPPARHSRGGGNPVEPLLGFASLNLPRLRFSHKLLRPEFR